MFHDTELPRYARSLDARRAILADSMSDLAESAPLIALTVGQQLVTDLGFIRASHIAAQISEEVVREGQRQQYRSAFEAAPVEPMREKDVSAAVPWLLGASGIVMLAMFLLLANFAAAEALAQRDLYRALGDEAPAYLVEPQGSPAEAQ